MATTKKFTELPEDAAPTSDDIVAIAHDPLGSPVSRFVKLLVLLKKFFLSDDTAMSWGAPADGQLLKRVGAAVQGVDINELIEDLVALRLIEGTGIDIAYNDTTGEITITNTAPDTGSPPTAEEVQDIVGAMMLDNSDLDMTYDDGAGTQVATLKGGASALSPAVETLADGATITWATSGKRVNNAEVTLGGNRTLDITGEVDGATGILVVTQDGTGGRTLTLPGSSKVINGGAGAVALSPGAGEVDILTWVFLGTTFYWTVGLDYT